MSADEAASPPLNDTPAVDRLWDGLMTWLIGVVAVVGLALAVAATLGWPRRAPAALSGTQLAVLLGVEWADPREPDASWGRLLGGSVQLAALEAGPVGYVLWHF